MAKGGPAEKNNKNGNVGKPTPVPIEYAFKELTVDQAYVSCFFEIDLK